MVTPSRNKQSAPPPPSLRGWPRRDEDRFPEVWLPFVLSVENLTKCGQNRLTDRMQPFTSQVFSLVRDSRFSTLVDSMWTLAPEDVDGPSTQMRTLVMDCLVEELKGTTKANQMTYEGGQGGRVRKWFAKRAPACLSASSTAVGSLKDILETWSQKNPSVSSALTVFKESIDIFRDLRTK